MNVRSWLAVILVATSLAGSGPLSAETALEAGARLAQIGDLDGALAAYREAVEQDPASAIARTRLGGLELLTQHYSDAIRSFKTAISLDPENPDAFVGLGMGYLHMGDYSLSRAALAEARQRSPAKAQQIDEVIAWIDARESGGAKGNHP